MSSNYEICVTNPGPGLSRNAANPTQKDDHWIPTPSPTMVISPQSKNNFIYMG